MSAQDTADFSLRDLFRMEAESQTLVLSSSLLALERDPSAKDQLEACMRAAHSLKGAARIVDLPAGVSVAHAMEDCFVAAQEGRIVLHHPQIDRLLASPDLLTRIALASDTITEVDDCVASSHASCATSPSGASGRRDVVPGLSSAVEPTRPWTGPSGPARHGGESESTHGPRGESNVESRWVNRLRFVAAAQAPAA